MKQLEPSFLLIEMQNVMTICKTVWQFPTTLNKCSQHSLETQPPGIYPGEVKTNATQILYLRVCDDFIYSHQKMKTTQIPFDQ